jgi:hypothetical protein
MLVIIVLRDGPAGSLSLSASKPVGGELADLFLSEANFSGPKPTSCKWWKNGSY